MIQIGNTNNHTDVHQVLIYLGFSFLNLKITLGEINLNVHMYIHT